ncbi:MAG TPA: hydrogen gas-evolving membrane-bound hydrogenase subunit E [Thermoleophilaceae bacterium]|nr:hydrogen gas-evolving membrane-bound hydrogenase subunit E [Thermoleophilaceae bacterium]
MSRRARLWLFAPALAGLVGLLVWGLTGLPSFGHYRGPYGKVLAKVAVPERKATDVVATTTFDYRGFDTLGEEMILFTAALGLVVLLREQRGEQKEEEDTEHEGEPKRSHRTSDALRILGLGLVGPTVVLGVYIVTHGHLTPGGGFQGGVILATALLIVYLAGRYAAMRKVSPIPLVEAGEAGGAAAFALIGLGGLIIAGIYMKNFIDPGTAKMLLSGGTIPLLNISVGLEVAGAFTLAFTEFLDQTLLLKGGVGKG